MRRVLITGQNSYIGTSVERWLLRDPDKYSVDTIDMIGDHWRAHDFSNYDVVFHVAGIAHVSSDPKMEELYYKVNRDLTIETAKKAKEEGVKQFIFMSSIIVYGDNCNEDGVIDRNTTPKPKDFYGDSKLQAEEGIKLLDDDDFKVTVVRPPMIYGKGSKGNYPRLSKLARKTPIFPDFPNQRSMLHIDNLCEFIRVIIDHIESGVFFPQNAEYVGTSELVKAIAQVHGKNVHLTKLFNPLIKVIFSVGIVKKIFGNQIYDKSMSTFSKLVYQIRSFDDSIRLTEIS